MSSKKIQLTIKVEDSSSYLRDDAEKSHVSMIEKFWSTLVEELTSNVKYPV